MGGLKAVILAILLYCFHSLEEGERSASKRHLTEYYH